MQERRKRSGLPRWKFRGEFYHDRQERKRGIRVLATEARGYTDQESSKARRESRRVVGVFLSYFRTPLSLMKNYFYLLIRFTRDDPWYSFSKQRCEVCLAGLCVYQEASMLRFNHLGNCLVLIKSNFNQEMSTGVRKVRRFCHKRRIIARPSAPGVSAPRVHVRALRVEASQKSPQQHKVGLRR